MATAVNDLSTTIITSKDNTRIKNAKKLYKKKNRISSYLIEGQHLYEEALKSGANVKQIFVTEKFADIPDAILVSDEVMKFLSDAEKLDTMMGKIKPYWATNKEMLARAGACYVSDKLEEMGKENGYLVSGASEDAFKDISQFSPNPQGEDRVRINQVLDISFEGIRERLKKDVEFEYPNINQESVRMDM